MFISVFSYLNRFSIPVFIDLNKFDQNLIYLKFSNFCVDFLDTALQDFFNSNENLIDCTYIHLYIHLVDSKGLVTSYFKLSFSNNNSFYYDEDSLMWVFSFSFNDLILVRDIIIFVCNNSIDFDCPEDCYLYISKDCLYDLN
jgi:hypothetical protein